MTDDSCACGCSTTPENETEDDCTCGCGGSEHAPQEDVVA